MFENLTDNAVLPPERASSRRDEGHGAAALNIRGSAFGNSAAKFWSALVDEVCGDYPECDSVVLDTLTGTPLSRQLLHPQAALQNDIDRLVPSKDFGRAMREALAEMDIMGPPDFVRARLMSGSAVLKSCVMPFECVDADVFSYLLAWLLEWSEIPEWLWNDECVEGGFSADDAGRGLRYDVDLAIVNEHVSEGLFRRTLTIRHKSGIQKT